MSLDITNVGIVAAELMETLAERFADEPDESKVGAVALVVEIESERWSEIHYQCSDRRPWIHRAMFVEAHRVATASGQDD